MGLFIIVLLWAVALVPPWLRSRREGRPSDSIVSFRQQLSVLERTTPGNHGAVTHLAPYRAAGAPRSPGAHAVAKNRRMARKRRRDVLFTLVAAAGITLVLAVVLGGAVVLLHLLVDALLAGYVTLLLRMQQQVVERDQKVRYLPGSSTAPEPALLLRRSAN
ncbi:hypothetical protein BH24ACT3_BH24ACT3_18170 [soil metagenome]